MDLKYDPSLVLYLPLYELDGASCISRDKHGHLATVTGALWTPHGRDFDGIDDKIVISYAFNPGASDFAILGWFYPTRASAAADSLFESDKANAHSAGNYGLDFEYEFNTGENRLYAWFSDATNQVSCFQAFSLNAWHHFALIRNGTLWRINIDLVAGTDGNVSTYSMNYDAAFATTLGTRFAGAQPYQGKIGEVVIYNRALTPLEIQRNYLATRWRYQ